MNTTTQTRLFFARSYISYIPFALLLMPIIACHSNKGADKSIDKNPTVFLNPHFLSHNNDWISPGFPVYGKKSIISYTSYGCFNHSSASLQIEKRDDGYFLIKRGSLNKPGKPLLVSPPFSMALAAFYRYYISLSGKQAKGTYEKDFQSTAAIQKLRLQGGLQDIELTVDSSYELTGYYALLHSIDRYIAE